MGNSSQVLIKKKKTDFFANFESINLYIHPSQTQPTSLIIRTLRLKARLAAVTFLINS